MKLFLSYVRLIRPFNLIIIAFTLYMVRLFFVLGSDGKYPEIPIQVYALFSLSFVFMAAGGYVINDYYDIEIDKINKPNKVIIGNIISTRAVLNAYWLLSILGVASGFISCYWAGVPLLATLFLFYWVALWFYSYKLKSAFLIGNILIGLCLALVPLGGTCINIYSNAAAGLPPDEKKLIWEMMLSIAAFAFLSALIREIVKDAEDMEGDKAAGCLTMPIVIGVKKTKWVLYFLILLLNAALGFVAYQFKDLGLYPLAYFIVFIQLPFILILYRLIKADSNHNFHQISIWLKILMLTGMIYVFTLADLVYNLSLFFSSFSNSFK